MISVLLVAAVLQNPVDRAIDLDRERRARADVNRQRDLLDRQQIGADDARQTAEQRRMTRIWTVRGRDPFEARFVLMKSNLVWLAVDGEDRHSVELPYAKFSAEDRAWVSREMRERAARIKASEREGHVPIWHAGRRQF